MWTFLNAILINVTLENAGLYAAILQVHPLKNLIYAALLFLNAHLNTLRLKKLHSMNHS